MNPKEAAGQWAASQVASGMKVGLGTGTTAFFAILHLGERVRGGLDMQATATSLATEQLAREQQIPLLPLADIGPLDLCIDGADEISPELNLIKGGGGALFREKMTAQQARRFLVVADPSKIVPQLGKFPLPVEVVPFAHEITAARLLQMDLAPRLRRDSQGAPFTTDNGNHIYDCHLLQIDDPVYLERKLKSLTGVVDTGLFLHMADLAIIGQEDGSVQLLEPEIG